MFHAKKKKEKERGKKWKHHGQRHSRATQRE